jgi:hypothetical protein
MGENEKAKVVTLLKCVISLAQELAVWRGQGVEETVLAEILLNGLKVLKNGGRVCVQEIARDYPALAEVIHSLIEK